MNSSDEFEHFILAQNPIYERVQCELAAGEKRSHWMWFIFPQLAGLGSSPMSYQYSLKSLEEARRYLQHKILGARLRECTQLVLNVQNKSVTEIFSYPDNLKFRSCMTLFSLCAPEESLFQAALEKYFGGTPDPMTLHLLQQ